MKSSEEVPSQMVRLYNHRYMHFKIDENNESLINISYEAEFFKLHATITFDEAKKMVEILNRLMAVERETFRHL